ncbi:hypothetical protein KKH82_03780 [Patescibacteria group bacterium]|nr:hypothetical protein [Patescibacteria group bacterium]
MLSNYGPFELFINKGNLYIDPITVVLPMTDFNTDGFPTSVGNSINK